MKRPQIPWAAAIREVHEETGLTFEYPFAWYGAWRIPIDIDEHRIPESSVKDEQSHRHFDFRYIFISSRYSLNELSSDEIASVRWFRISDVLRDSEYRTVKTLLDRIAAKGYLDVEKLGPLCLFKPSVRRPQALAAAIDEFVGTVLDDTLSPLFLHLAKDKEMTPEELESLRELLENHEAAGRERKKRS